MDMSDLDGHATRRGADCGRDGGLSMFAPENSGPPMRGAIGVPAGHYTDPSRRETGKHMPDTARCDRSCKSVTSTRVACDARILGPRGSCDYKHPCMWMASPGMARYTVRLRDMQFVPHGAGRVTGDDDMAMRDRLYKLASEMAMHGDTRSDILHDLMGLCRDATLVSQVMRDVERDGHEMPDEE